MLDTATRRSLSTLRSHDLYLFFIYVSAEKVFSHRYVDANGNSTSVAAFDNATRYATSYEAARALAGTVEYSLTTVFWLLGSCSLG